MAHYTQSDLANFDREYRKHFVNSLSGYKSANLVGTISNEGVTNLAVFNSAVHVGTNPPLMGLVLRPHTVVRHTLQNIEANKHFTINHVAEGFF